MYPIAPKLEENWNQVLWAHEDYLHKFINHEQNSKTKSFIKKYFFKSFFMLFYIHIMVSSVAITSLLHKWYTKRFIFESHFLNSAHLLETTVFSFMILT